MLFYVFVAADVERNYAAIFSGLTLFMNNLIIFMMLMYSRMIVKKNSKKVLDEKDILRHNDESKNYKYNTNP